MDTFTQACMGPTLPSMGSLPSIGSVRAMHERANAETADKSDFHRFRTESDPHADHILQMYGQQALDDYSQDVAAHHERVLKEETERHTRRVARIAKMHRFFSVHAKIEQRIATIFEKATHRHLAR